MQSTQSMKLATIQVQQFLTDIAATKAQDGLDSGFNEAESFAKIFREESKTLKKISKDERILKFQEEIDQSFEEFYSMGKEMANAYITSTTKEGNLFMKKFDPSTVKITNLLEQQMQAVSNQSKDDFADITNQIKNAIVIILPIAVLGSIFALFGIFAINTMIKKLTSTLYDSSAQIGKGVNKIAEGNKNLLLRTESQASSLEETSATLEQITSTLKQTTDNTRNAKAIASKATLSVQDGLSAFKDSLLAIAAISESSKKIAEIVELVESISFQTNILAINAAIEAAKAGEQGKGFAVVAIEVRDLAQRSAEATKEIRTLIKISSDRVENGSKIVRQNSENLHAISTDINSVAGIISEISSAMNEQHTAIEQINLAMTDLDSTTQQNGSFVKEIATESEHLENTSLATKESIRQNLGDELKAA
ncbi:MAG: hypothetical protein HQK50_00525 [Oligoflexia bacterium]|nr:hypothetical protein [Oligoflexia bacterium]